MSVLTIYRAMEEKRLEVPPRIPVMEAVSSVVGIATSEVLFADNGERTFHRESVRGDIGCKKWEVVVEGPSLEERVSALEFQIQEQKTHNKMQDNRIGVLEEIQLVPWLRNVAATVLLFLDDQPYTDTTSHRFRHAKGDLRYRITEYVNASGTWSLDKFQYAADGIITRRNAAIHPSSVGELDDLVEQALDAMARSPAVASTIRQEAIILREYSEIKKFFPGSISVKATEASSEIDDAK